MFVPFASCFSKKVADSRSRYVDYLNRGRSVNKLALMALNVHAVNLVTEDQGSKVTFV